MTFNNTKQQSTYPEEQFSYSECDHAVCDIVEVIYFVIPGIDDIKEGNCCSTLRDESL